MTTKTQPLPTDALLPCPFCGSAASLHNDTDSPCWFVGCSNSACLIEPHHYADTEAEAIATWNRRAPTPVGMEPVEKFDNPLVQAVYAILCDDTDWPPKETPQQHWEGWIARRIVDQVLAMGQVPLPSIASVEMIDAAMVEMQKIYPPLRRSECRQLIDAALGAAHKFKQGANHD